MRHLVAGSALAASLCAVPSVASALPPTTTAPVATVVGAQVTGTTDDNDKTGLWGLAGALGLLGLAGLKRRRDTTAASRGSQRSDATPKSTPATGVAPPRAEGATGHNP